MASFDGISRVFFIRNSNVCSGGKLGHSQSREQFLPSFRSVKRAILPKLIGTSPIDSQIRIIFLLWLAVCSTSAMPFSKC
jgi:hypothetical protein